MGQKLDKQEKEQVQKLQLYDVCDYLLSADKETQLRMLDLLVNDLGLTNIRQAEPILKASYNGVKFHRETKTIGKTIFAVLKGNVK